MSNTYFQFKQFTVQQHKCAMKVCTDACLFGAIVAKHIQLKKVNRLLDIGTGTGLLSLMLAQQGTAFIDAVEIDTGAYEQAENNFAASPWADRLQAHQTDILKFNPQQQYDVIISNPPFFEGNLKSGDAAKNTAKHESSLSLKALMEQVKRLLQKDGLFAILLPYHRLKSGTALAAEAGLQLQQQILIKQSLAHDFFRCVLIFDNDGAGAATLSTINIKDSPQIYSAAFTQLLRAYYLHL